MSNKVDFADILAQSTNQRVQYNKTRESVEIYTTTANKLPHQKGG